MPACCSAGRPGPEMWLVPSTSFIPYLHNIHITVTCSLFFMLSVHLVLPYLSVCISVKVQYIHNRTAVCLCLYLRSHALLKLMTNKQLVYLLVDLSVCLCVCVYNNLSVRHDLSQLQHGSTAHSATCSCQYPMSWWGTTLANSGQWKTAIQHPTVQYKICQIPNPSSISI